MKKKRGLFLTITLIVMFILLINLFGISVLPSEVYLSMYKNVPSWLSTFVLINTMVDFVILVGIALWKKLAVYAYLVSVIIGILIEFLILEPYSLNASLIGFFVQGLLLWAISLKWKYFE